MATKKISELTAATEFTGADTIVMVQGGATRRIVLPIKMLATAQEPTLPSLFIGQNAGAGVLKTDQGYANTVIGFEAAEALHSTVASEASSNVVVGHRAAEGITTGSYNTFIGTVSGSVIAAGARNVGLGYHTMLNCANVDDNLAIGYYSLLSAQTNRNVAIGSNALEKLTTGQYNVAIGWYAMQNTTTCLNSVAIGYSALAAATTTGENTAIGYRAGLAVTTGSLNTLIGGNAGYQITEGNLNVIVGSAATGLTTGENNILIGYGAVCANYSESIVLGRNAAADGNNQFVVGAPSYEAGTITSEAVVSDATWTVKINGTNYKILLKA